MPRHLHDLQEWAPGTPSPSSREKFSAAGDLDVTFSFADKDHTLLVSGVVVDTIQTLSPGYTGGETYAQWEAVADVKDVMTDILNEVISKSNGNNDVPEQTNIYVAGGSKAKAFWRALLARCRDSLPHKVLKSEDNIVLLDNGGTVGEWMAQIMERIVLVFSNRKLFITKKGYLGPATIFAAQGDTIAVIVGCKVPIVLRKLEGDEKDNAYVVVGEAFVDGLMNGEAAEEGNGEEFGIGQIILR